MPHGSAAPSPVSGTAHRPSPSIKWMLTWSRRNGRAGRIPGATWRVSPGPGGHANGKASFGAARFSDVSRPYAGEVSRKRTGGDWAAGTACLNWRTPNRLS